MHTPQEYPGYFRDGRRRNDTKPFLRSVSGWIDNGFLSADRLLKHMRGKDISFPSMLVAEKAFRIMHFIFQLIFYQVVVYVPP